MNLMSWILMGLIIGIVANSLDYNHKNLIIGWLGVSVLGSLVGGLLGSLVIGVSPLGDFSLGVLTMASLFSILLIILLITDSELKLPKYMRGRHTDLFKFEGKIHHGAFRKV